MPHRRWPGAPDKQAPAPTLRYGVSFAGSTRSFSLCGGEFEHHIVAVCLVTRTFEPRQSRLYGVGGSSAFGNICADAIVKSSTSPRNSVSLNSRMLAYAATTRSARTRALRSCVILISAIAYGLRVINPPSLGLNFKSQPNITPDGCAAPTTHGFLNIVSSQETKAARNSHLPKDAAQTQKFAIHGNLSQTNVSIVSKLANLSIRSSVGLVSGFSPGDTRVHRQIKGVAVQTNPTNTSRVSNAHRGAPGHAAWAVK